MIDAAGQGGKPDSRTAPSGAPDAKSVILIFRNIT